MDTQVFISYSHKDKLQVLGFARELTGVLQARGYTNYSLWIDEWKVKPGDPFLSAIDEAMKESSAIAVIFGPSGIGQVGTAERDVAVLQNFMGKARVVPIVMEGAPVNLQEDLPGFFSRLHWVDLRGEDRDYQIEKLLWAVTGDEPQNFPDPVSRAVAEPETAPGFDAADVVAPAAAGQEVGVEPTAVNVLDPRTELILRTAINKFNDQLGQGKNSTFFLGTGAAQGDEENPPSVQDLARDLYSQLDLTPGSPDGPYLPVVDALGTYYRIKNDETGLDEHLKQLIKRRSRRIPDAYVKLVMLLAKVGAMRASRQTRAERKHLIFTTNWDLLMETALIKAGIGFLRLVQLREGASVHVQQFKGDLDSKRTPEGDERKPGTILESDLQDIEQVLETDIPKLPENPTSQEKREDPLGDFVKKFAMPATIYRRDVEQQADNSLEEINLESPDSIILYKFHGSVDIPKSCAISSDHYLSFISDKYQKNFVPEEIRSTISITPSFFLGYGPLDPDLRLTYHTLREEFLSGDPDGDMRYTTFITPVGAEQKLWGEIKDLAYKPLKMQAIEVSPTDFLDRLINSLD